MEIVKIVLLVIFSLASFLLVLLVLAQDEQGEGIGGLFSGGSATSFGSRAGNILTKTTSILGFIFLTITLVLALMFRTPQDGAVTQTFQNEVTATEWWKDDQAAVIGDEVGAETETVITTLESPAESQ